MKLVVLALALAMCACGDGRIERAFASVPAFYPATTSEPDATIATLQRKLEQQEQQRQTDQIILESAIDDLRNNTDR